MLSTTFGHVASATSCSNFDADEYEKKDAELHSIYSACLGLDITNEKQHKMTAEDFSDYHHYFRPYDDDHEDMGSNSEHRFDWSAYKLEHDKHDEHGMLDYEDDDHHREYEDHHGYRDNHGAKHWDEHEKHYCLPRDNEAVVPVPAAFWMFCSGLFALLMASRRKAR